MNEATMYSLSRAGMSRRSITSSCAQSAELCFSLAHALGETHAALRQTRTVNPACGKFEIIHRDFQRFTGRLEEHGFEFATGLNRRVPRHHRNTAGITAEVHRRPQNTVTPPLLSSFIWTPEWGMSFQ